MIGIDLVKIERIAASARSEHFLERVFTSRELTYYREKGGRAETLAGLFAAKEAVSKALGTGVRGFFLTDIEILHSEYGAPVVMLHGAAEELANGKTIAVSISHDGDYAIATAMML